MVLPGKVAPMMYVKVVGPSGEPINGGTGAWPLPDGDAPGEWWTVAGDIVGCVRGLHVTTPEHALFWAGGCTNAVLYRAETDGPVQVVDDTKSVCGRARLHGPALPVRALRDARESELQRIEHRHRQDIDRADAKLARAGVSEAWYAYANACPVDASKYTLPGVASAISTHRAEVKAAGYRAARDNAKAERRVARVIARHFAAGR